MDIVPTLQRCNSLFIVTREADLLAGPIKKAVPLVSKGRPYWLLPACGFAGGESEHLNLRCTRAFLPHACNERDALVFFQGFVSSALNFTVVCEEVLAARLGHDKAEAFLVVEPLHNTEGTAIAQPLWLPIGLFSTIRRESQI